MRMRQSLADIEAAFVEEMESDRERAHKHGSLRFWLVLLTLIPTAVIVTIAMFETLYYVMG